MGAAPNLMPMRKWHVLPCLVLCSVGVAWAGGRDLNGQVLDFCRSHLGQKVGNGQCSVLVDMALRSSGALPLGSFGGAVTDDGDYVWGRSITLNQLEPGDVLQFRNFRYHLREDRFDGSWYEWNEDFPHHSAVVVSYDGNGKVTIIEQNAPAGGPVKTEQIPLTSHTERTALANVTVKVSGQVWFYRPVPSR